MWRLICAAGVAASMLLPAPALAATVKQKRETCLFGADDQKLTGAARKKFLANCMANRDSPRGKPIEAPRQ